MLQFNTSHFLTGEELSQTELNALIQNAERLRLGRGVNTRTKPLRGKTIGLMFEKPSLRTRVSFTVGIQELGGFALELVSSQVKKEEPEDSIRVLQGMIHGLMLRTFDHSTLERMVKVAKIPIINGLSDTHHPCQAIADLQTLHQNFGHTAGLKLAYIGDGNNVLHSLLLLAPYAGVDVHFACPAGFEPDAKILARAELRAARMGTRILKFPTPDSAVKNCHAVYTDVWTSMGFEEENTKRIKAFKGYQLNLDLFQMAHSEAIAMHCLPMIREQEITSEVVEHPRSALFQQAENRLHAQKSLITGLFSGISQRQDKELSYSDVI